MVLSRSYQQTSVERRAKGEESQTREASDSTLSALRAKLFSGHAMRRLTAEEIRDSLLQLTGELKSEQARATAHTYGEDLDDPMKLDAFTHRSVYLPVARNNLAPDLEIFDAANPEMTSGERPLTTVPTQALYLLNSSFLQQRAASLAQRAYAMPEPVKWLHETILGRAPDAAAEKRASDFINTANNDREKALADLAHVLLAATEFLFLE